MIGLRILVFLYLCAFPISLFAADNNSNGDSNGDSNGGKTEENELLPRFDQVFENPFLIQSLNAGSQVANTAFDSLLEGVFYHLLDNKFTQKITGTVSLDESLTRQVFTTGQGKYVIADRINIGPSYKQNIAKIFKKLPTSLVANTGIDLVSIYLRSDPQRVLEKNTLPTWRYWFNMWFGVIPFLEYVLPPSFDPNQLYDPLREIESPFSFPIDLDSFKKMEVGSIQSYAFQGTVAIPINIDGFLSPYIVEKLGKMNLNVSVPYTLFAQGEYRINVLKKNDRIAWVGLSKLKRGGHSLAGFAGTTIYLLANSLGSLPWSGVPAQFSPLDISIVEAIADKYDQIYEFDLGNPQAVPHFQSAIAGNFDFGLESKLPDGVRFHFSQTSLSRESEKKNSKNFILIYKAATNDLLTKSEIKIRDDRGEFYVLENTSSYNDTHFNILTGERTIDLSNELNLNVEKERESNFLLDDPRYVYRFHHTMKPYQLILKFQIKDRFADVSEFYKYIDLLKKITRLPMDGIPEIPLITEKNIIRRQKRAFFSAPNENSFNLHPTNSLVGKFNANAIVIFDSNDLKQILGKKLNEIKRTFYASYGRDESDDLAPFFEYSRYLAAYPLRVFNYKSKNNDAYREITKAYSTLSQINPDSLPIDILSAFNRLFTTDYPYELISAFYDLCDVEKIPRSATLYISPSGDIEDTTKKALTDLNGKTFASSAKFPEQERYRVAKSKLNAFVPGSFTVEQKAPKMGKVHLSPEQILRVSLDKKDPPVRKRFFVYVRSLSRFKITESNIGTKLIEIDATKVAPDTVVYEIPLFVRGTPLYELINAENLDDDTRYSIAISASEMEGPWSEELTTTVLYKNGKFELSNEE